MNVAVEAVGAAQGGILGLIVTMPIETVQKTQVFRVDVFLYACKRGVAACEATAQLRKAMPCADATMLCDACNVCKHMHCLRWRFRPRGRQGKVRETSWSGC